MLKKIIFTAISLVVIVVAAIAIIMATIDPNDYRDEITQVVKKHTGRELEFENIELSFYPNIGTNLDNVHLSNAAGFEGKEFLNIEQMHVSVAILPLLSQQLEIDTLTLHGLNVHLARNAEGVTNWDDLIQTKTTDDNAEKKQQDNPLEKLQSLNFGGLDIRNGQIHWQDQLNQQNIDLTEFNLVTSAVTFGEFFNIDLSANTHVSQPELNAQLKANVDVKFDQDGSFAIKNLTQSSQLQGKALPIEQLDAELNIPSIALNLEQKKYNLGEIGVKYSVTGGQNFPLQNSAGTITISQLSADLNQQLITSEKVSLNSEVTGSKTLPIKQAQAQLTIPALTFNLEQQLAKLSKLELSYNAQGAKDFPLKKTDGKLQLGNIAANLTSQQLSADDLKIDYDVTTDKSLPINTAKGSASLKKPKFNLTEQALSSGLFTLKSNLTGEQLPNKKTTMTVSTQPSLNLTKQSASLSKLSVKTMDIQADGAVKVAQLMDQPNVSASLNVKQFNLRKLLKALQLDIDAVNKMSDKKTLTKVAAKANVSFNSKTQAVSAKAIKINLDDSVLTGQASLKNFDKPNIGYNLNLNKINVSRYLPPKPKQPETKKEEPVKDIEIPLPTELLRSLTLNGTFKAGSIQYEKLNPKNLLMTTKAKGGLIDIKPFKVDLFKSKTTATARLDVRGKQPKYATTLNTKNLPIGKVLIAFTGNDRVSGIGSVNAKLTSSGDYLSKIKKGLNGTVSANLKNGAVKGVNIAQAIRQAKAKVVGKAAAGSSEELQTDFSSLAGQFTIKNGIVTTKKLQAQAPYMRINGSGTVDLPKEKLNYLVKTKIVASDKGQGGEGLKDLNGLTIPVKLKGDWTSPKVSLDLESLLEQRAKQEVEKKLDVKKKEVEKQIEEKKKDITKDLEKQLKEGLLKGLPF